MLTTLKLFYHYIRIGKAKGTYLGQLKYFFQWQKSLQPGSTSVIDEQPWITFDAIRFLQKAVTIQSKVFEYGGGGSTLFFVKRAGEVITVEHDKEWSKILTGMIKKQYRNLVLNGQQQRFGTKGAGLSNRYTAKFKRTDQAIFGLAANIKTAVSFFYA